MTRIMLHACCAPCTLEPLDALAADADVTVCYANPNIHPADEYERRLMVLREYLADSTVDLVELPYEPETWAEATTGLVPPERCRACYRLRIGLVAAEAARLGYDAVATTLSVSPYQDQKAIAEEGELACSHFGVRFMAVDFRDRYAEATRRSRELGMYRQNYCGCAPSMKEAEEDRERRRRERALRKTAGG